MPGNFFDGEFFGGGFFGVNVTKVGTGGIDPQRRIYKPTGVLHLPKKGKLPPKVEQRVEETAQVQAEIAGKLAKEFAADNLARAPVEETINIDAINAVAREKLLAEQARLKKRKEEENLRILLMIGSS